MRYKLLNVLIGIGCIIASILLIVLTPIYFLVKFIGWVFVNKDDLDDILSNYLYLWEEIWCGAGAICRFY